MSDAFNDAQNIVNQVNNNGGESAARLMMDNINHARDDFKDTSRPSGVANGYNNYMNVLSEELQKSGVLPELSVGWAKANINDIGNGQSISDSDIDKFDRLAKNSTNPIDQMMIGSLKDQAQDLKDVSNDQKGRDTVISKADLYGRLATHSGDRAYAVPDANGNPTELGFDANARRAKVLFEKGENGRDLFDFLDGIQHQGERSGKVDRSDLQTFNRMAASDPEFRANFTAEQLQTVKELDARWDYEGQKIHDGGMFVQDLTRDSIAKGIGEEHGVKEIPARAVMNMAKDTELTEKVATDHKLFDALDGIGRGGKKPGLDGMVQRDDVVAFNALAEKGDPRIVNNFTPEQIKTVRELETQWGYMEGYDYNSVMRKSDKPQPASKDESAAERYGADEGTKRLLEQDDKLFNILDGMRNDGKRDGNVYRSDLVAFNERAKNDSSFANQFTADELKTVKELETHWDEGRHLHVNMDYMTQDSIAKGLGFNEVTVKEQVEYQLNPPPRVADEEVPEEQLDHKNEIREPKVQDTINKPGDNRKAIDESDARIRKQEEELMKRSVEDEPRTRPDANKRDFEVSREVTDEFMRAAKQRPGEGPYQVATRLLLGEGASPVGHHTKIMELARILKRDYQDRTGDRTDKMVNMKVGENFLTEANGIKILGLSPALNERFNQRYQQKVAGRDRTR